MRCTMVAAGVEAGNVAANVVVVRKMSSINPQMQVKNLLGQNDLHVPTQ